MHGGPDGSFRATFEDKPLLSDIIFLRAWVAVDLPRFFNPVTNLLAPPPAPPAVARKHRRDEVHCRLQLPSLEAHKLVLRSAECLHTCYGSKCHMLAPRHRGCEGLRSHTRCTAHASSQLTRACVDITERQSCYAGRAGRRAAAGSTADPGSTGRCS